MTLPVLLKRRDYPLVNWKNSKGKSAEIAIFPAGTSFAKDPFVWRLSSAQVMEPGPFSEFPGYDRYLALVEGKSLKLQFSKSGKSQSIVPGEVCRFSGNDPISCELPAGAVTDLNLIVRQKAVRVEFKVLTLSLKPRSFSMEGKCGFVFGLSGPIAASVYPGEDRFQIHDGDTLRVDCPDGDETGERLILLEPGQGDCRVALIELDW